MNFHTLIFNEIYRTSMIEQSMYTRKIDKVEMFVFISAEDFLQCLYFVWRKQGQRSYFSFKFESFTKVF